MQQYPQGLISQSEPPYQNPVPRLQQIQEVRFYKSGIFGFSSAAGRFERDQRMMATQGWRVKEMAFLGLNFWLRRIVAVVYER
jgi:hypothetical protein